jgi:hypothetical protein
MAHGEKDPLGIRIDKHFEHLKGKRSTWERHWQELAEYVLPHRSDFTSKRSLGEERLEMAFEGTAMRALKRFASQIHNVFTPMGAEWFKLTTGIPGVDKQRDVQLWLEEASKIVKHHISRPSSNFHSAIYQYYLEAGAFGTGIVFVEDIPGIGPRFRNFPLSDCVLAAGGEMEIDTIYRMYKQTAKDLVSRYPPESLPEDVLKKGIGEKMLEEEDVVHLVTPSWTLREFLPEKWDKPFVSITYLKDKKKVIQVGAYDEMPYICARWERSDREIYGRGPAWEVLPDMRLLNEVEKVYLKGVQKAISPPMFVPDSGLLDPLDTTPDAINYYNVGIGGKDMIFPAPNAGKVEYAMDLSAKLTGSIKEGFFLDVLELPGPTAPDGDVMRFSATEVSVRMRQRMPVLGPLLARQENEFLDPLIRRTVKILMRSMMLGEPPPVLEEIGYRIEYINPISISLRSGEVNSMVQLFEMIMPLAQIDQTIPMYFDTHKILQNTAEVLQVPPSNLRTQEQVAEIIKKQEEQQALQQEQQQAQLASQVDERQANAEAKRAQARAA